MWTAVYERAADAYFRLARIAMPAAKPMTAGSSQPRFLSNRGRCAAAKAMGASRWSAVCTGAGSVFMQSKMAAAHVPVMVAI